MASNIPTRRITRATRAAVKEDENANARTSRITTRAKPQTTAGASATGGPARNAAHDGAQHKRKREALGELTGKAVNNDKTKRGADKGKEKESAPLKPGKASTSTATTRVPLRTVGGVATRSRSNVVTETKAAKAKPANDEPMDIVRPQMPVPVVLVTASSATFTTATTRHTSVRASTSDIGFVSRKSSQSRKTSSYVKEPEPEIPTEEPVFKKRRTSSEFGDEPELQVVEEETEPPFADEIVQQIVDDDVGWDDLDRDDDDDPLMVSEYVVEIFNYLKRVEKTTMPNPNYMENQKELAWKMRGILIDWLIQVHSRFKLLPETLFLCVNLIDRFLSARVVSLNKLQLVGVTCMFIAAKVEETVAPSVKNFIYCADSTYNEAEILSAEKYVLKTLEWNLSYPCPLHFLRRISKADDYDIRTRTIGKYLIEIGCLEWRLLAAPPSLLAAASMWLARLILDLTEWTPNLRHFSSYREEQLIPTANLILNYVVKPNAHDSFNKKYASKRYMKASVYVRQWALDRWEEHTLINLAEDLPRVKLLAIENRELAAAEQAAAEATGQAVPQ